MIALQPQPLTVRGTGEQPLVGRDMLCFSHDWSGDPLSKTHLMRLLARDNRVLWVNSIGYRAPTASAADLGRAWRKLKAATAPHDRGRAQPASSSIRWRSRPGAPVQSARSTASSFGGRSGEPCASSASGGRSTGCSTRPPRCSPGTLGEDRSSTTASTSTPRSRGVPSESLIAMERGLCRRADLVDRVGRATAPDQRGRVQPANRARSARRRLRPFPPALEPADARFPTSSRACRARSSATSA